MASRCPCWPRMRPPDRAAELGRRCRDMGLEPLLMFSMIYPEDPRGLEVLTQRVKQAAAAGVPQVLDLRAHRRRQRAALGRAIQETRVPSPRITAC